VGSAAAQWGSARRADCVVRVSGGRERPCCQNWGGQLKEEWGTPCPTRPPGRPHSPRVMAGIHRGQRAGPTCVIFPSATCGAGAGSAANRLAVCSALGRPAAAAATGTGPVRLCSPPRSEAKSAIVRLRAGCWPASGPLGCEKAPCSEAQAFVQRGPAKPISQVLRFLIRRSVH
jgi:hypothetical protein